MAPNKMGDGTEEQAMSELSDAINSEARLESILAQVRVLKAKHDKRAKITGENFNVFSILDRERYEVTTHSAIIAELLNPQGSHSQRTLFLKLFLKQLEPIILNSSSESSKRLKSFLERLKPTIRGASLFQACSLKLFLKRLKPTINASNELTGFKVRTEKFIFDPVEEKKGFLDIVIESDDAYILIENKIDTADAEGQLEKYCKHIEEIEKNTKALLYLTPEGKKPNNLTLYDKGEIALECLSYKDFIIKWLDNCIKEVYRIPQIRETLHQYQMTVKKLTGQPINRRYAMALKDILLEDKNFNLIPGLEVALSYAQTDLQFKFWSELKSQLESPKVRKDLNNKVKNLRYEVHLTQLRIDKKEETTKKCIRKRPRLQSPGLTFNFSEENGKYEIMFRITHDGNWDRLYYGFVLCEKGGDKKVAINEKEHEEYLKKYRIYDAEKGGWGDGWLTYRYFEKPEIDSIDHKSVEKYNQKLVEELVKEICKVINKISKDKATD